MRSARKKMLVADLLCGAGGSSTGCARALSGLGLEMELVCINHWATAIETHKKNHPEARHYCQDIASVRPHLVVPEGYLDLLLASPTCTHHSAARGGKPTSDQQRSDPWHIVTWLTELRVKRVLIENVPEFLSWGPVDARTGKPIKSRRGEYFRAWTDTIRRLGFDLEWRILNAADYGDATTRRRFFLEARSDGKPLVWPAPTHIKREDGKLALFPTAKPWRAAREIIDWTIKGRSIFGRKKPLSAKTLARIYAGAVKFKWPEPFLVILRNHMDAQTVDGPVPSIAANGGHIGLAQPVIVRTDMHGRKSPGARGADDPLMTITTRGGIAVAQAFIATGAHGNDAAAKAPDGRRCRSLDDPLQTIHAGGGKFAVVEPFVLNRHGADGGDCRAKPVSEPVPTATKSGGGYIVEPFVLSRQGGGAPRSIEEPTPAQVAKHSHVLIAPYYGSGSGESCSSAEAPLPTVTGRARHAMVVPITHGDGVNRARDAGAPLPTITTAKRGELAFITAAFGERPTQAPRVHDVAEPAPTIPAQGRINLVQGEALASPEGGPLAAVDILFRMLEPHELAAAMGFDSDEAAYEFVGTKTEKIKQIGNAVPVNTACALVKAVMRDAAAAPKPAAVRKAAAA